MKATEEEWRVMVCLFVCSFPGSSYYDNVRPLAYPDSDAVLICFDISRPETLDSVLKKVSLHQDARPSLFFSQSLLTAAVTYCGY